MVSDVSPNNRESQPGDGDERRDSRPSIAIRYGQMGLVGEFNHPADMKFACGAKVVIQTKRGIEIGEQVSVSCHGCSSSVTREQLLAFVSNSGPEYYSLNCGRVLREATSEDLAEYRHILGEVKEKRRICQELAAQHGLQIKVVACEPLFGGERIILYFVADGRVDFRALVKNLAREFQTRIEMRQVGARDEARLVADYETCGRECCCKNFLKNLKPVSMKMAKMQKATLDPSKVSGRCGRLKCCLRYEHSNYEELDRGLPRVGAKVRTAQGEGTVVARQILTQLLQVETESGGRLAVAAEELLKPGEEPKVEARPPEPPAESPFQRQTDGAKAPSTNDARPEASEPTKRRRRRRNRVRPRGGRGGPKGGGGKETPRGGPPTGQPGGG